MATKKKAAAADTPDTAKPAKATASPEAAVRKAAGDLQAAIAVARAAGYIVRLPTRTDMLAAGITISETKRVRG